MAKAVGIGGVFLHFEGEEKEVMDWYESELGFDMTDYGTGFTSGEQLILLSFKRSGPKGAYLNIRVDDLDALMNKFKAQGLKVLKDTEEFPYGKFSTIMDPFGNAIELWEPFVDEYKRMVAEEVKAYKEKKDK